MTNEVEAGVARLDELIDEISDELTRTQVGVVLQVLHAFVDRPGTAGDEGSHQEAFHVLARHLATSPPSRDALAKILELTKRHAGAAQASAPLSTGEQSALADAGVDLDALHQPKASEDVAARTSAAYAELVSASLTTSEAAERLGVSPSRVRQLIAERPLLSVRVSGRRLLPAWQFTEDGILLPGLADVLASLPADSDPLAVQQRLHSPDVDLANQDAQPRSPLQWLADGGDSTRVIALLTDGDADDTADDEVANPWRN